MMQAIVQTGYGSPAVFDLVELEQPTLKDDEVLVQVNAAGLHAGDVFVMRGTPYVARLVAGWPTPKNYVPGFDLAGTVAAVGKAVTRVQPGDVVFGGPGRALAEFAAADEAKLAAKPANLSFEQAAAVPTSALAALHGLRDAGKLQPGQKVLINGASGGVGTFAVQIAKALGAEVTGVCSTRNLALVRSLGADHVVDYTQEDFAQGEARYDLILDNVANRSFADVQHVLAEGGKVIPNSGNAGIGYVLKAYARSAYARQQGRPFVSSPNPEDLDYLKELSEAGKLTPVIDRTYPLAETAEAFRYLAEGHARGKVVIMIQDEGQEEARE